MHVTFGWFLDGPCHPLTATGQPAAVGAPVVGPQGLLGLLETRIGLAGPTMAGAVRIARYRARLAAADDGRRFYSASFGRDPWATAREVLAWRDGLCAAGWQGNGVPEGGPRLETLAAIETAGQPVIGPSPGERLTAVITLLATGRASGIARLTLATVRDRLPARWRHLVGLLESGGTAIGMASTPIEGGASDLATVRRALAVGRIDRTLAGDGSFVVIEADDEIQAADTVAAWAAADGADDNVGVVLVRGGGASFLDAACRRLGLPRPGAEDRSAQRGALQVLPLVLELFWAPPNPQRLLEFLSLPRRPIPRYVAKRFASALREEPGIGGPRWNEAWQEAVTERAGRVRADGADEKEIARRMAGEEDEWRFWLQPNRHFDPSEGIPSALVLEVCRRIARWAAGIGERDDDDLFRLAAAQASDLGKAITALGAATIPAVQLGRILDAVTGEGIARPDGGGEAAPWSVVSHPGQVWGTAGTILWWGFAGAMPAAPRLPWTRAESQALAAAGIIVEPPEAAILREAEAWRNPLRFARDRLILVAPRRVGGETVPPHPFWHELHPMLKEMKALDQVVVPAARLAAGEHLGLAGRPIARVAVTCVDLPEPRRLWLTPAGTIARRGTESVSSIKRLIDCPFAWALQYAARIRPGQINALPNDDQVIGTLAHAIIERLLTDGRAWTPDEAAAEAVTLFDRLLPTMAATLLRPGYGVERDRAREGVAEAVRVLVRLMTEAGLRVRACEDAITAPLGDGQQFGGTLDLALVDSKGRSVVLDLKWTNHPKYRRQELAEGRAWQLAAYAWLEEAHKRRVLGAGYFMLRQGLLFFSDPEPFPSVSHVAGTDLRETWKDLRTAYDQRMADLTGGTVAARGIEPDDGDAGEEPLADAEAPCRVCDYGALCGAGLGEA